MRLLESNRDFGSDQISPVRATFFFTILVAVLTFYSRICLIHGLLLLNFKFTALRSSFWRAA